MKYYSFKANYTEDVKINGSDEKISTNVTGYISDALFSSKEEMITFLKGYYHPSITIEEEPHIDKWLTDGQIAALSGEGFDPNWMEGRTSLFEWVTDVDPTGYEDVCSSGRQPLIKLFIGA